MESDYTYNERQNKKAISGKNTKWFYSVTSRDKENHKNVYVYNGIIEFVSKVFPKQVRL